VTADTLLFGAGGLVGGAVAARLAGVAPPSERTGCTPAVVRWARPEQAHADISGAVAAFAQRLRRREASDRGWQVVWAAGVAVVASSEQAAASETTAFERCLEAVETQLLAGELAGGGRLLLVSSAGGVYAGSRGAPFDERTVPVPLAAYGRQKLAQEALLAQQAGRSGLRGIVARLPNVYGDRQDLAKRQGLVSALCRAVLTREPLRIFVPLDTRRHLLWADDAGTAIRNLLGRTITDGPDVAVRVVVGDRAVSVAEIIAAVRRVTGRPPPILVTLGREARFHGRDLRLRTGFAGELGLESPLPLEQGVQRIWSRMLAGPRQR
jgi:UDP-glucose 4-epimerase